MPVGVYRKRTKNGQWMHFRDGKLISKSSYDSSKSRKKRTNSKPRKASNNKKNNSRRNMKRIPHPSVSGLASLAIIGSWINSKSGWTATQPSKDSVTGWLMQGNVDRAGKRLAENLKSSVTSSGGQKALIGSVLVATGGTIARKLIPNVKLGTDKWYLRI